MFDFLFQLIHELMFLAGYVGGANAFPKQLSSDEEKKYIDLFSKGDINARNILIEHNLRLVAHVTKKYSNESNADDLISVGIIGLIKGINSFNSKKNSRLATYIAKCIENEVLMYLRKVKKTSAEVSLDECIGKDKEGNSLTFADILPAENIDIIDEISMKSDTKKLYKIMRNVLKKDEIEIIVWRYGLSGKKRMTQQEIADILGISRSYVSRIEKKAIKKLSDGFKNQ